MTQSIRIATAVGLIGSLAVAGACRGRTDDGTGAASARRVTAYVSADRPFSEPIMREFERLSGIRVDVVYDTEETKSTGLANRLLAEKERPQADVFWSNEPVRTLVLKTRGVLAPYRSPSAEGIPSTFKDPEGYWTGFSARLRVIVYNTTLVPAAEAPTSVLDLADAKWRNQIAIADPRFGSTSFHVAALYAQLGDARADAFFAQLKANGVRIVDGNSVVRDLVAKGEIKVGLTDSDDVSVALEAGLPIAMVLPDRDGSGVPVMPNMVSLVAGAPHREEGTRLVDFLLSPEAERMLAASAAVQIPLHASVEPPQRMPRIDSIRLMTLDYGRAAARVEDVTRRLQTLLGL
jgi:iron(III) transport system substrate-binding protein